MKYTLRNIDLKDQLFTVASRDPWNADIIPIKLTPTGGDRDREREQGQWWDILPFYKLQHGVPISTT